MRTPLAVFDKTKIIDLLEDFHSLKSREDWSHDGRIWEYYFALKNALHYKKDGELRILDVGTGNSIFPYLIDYVYSHSVE